MSENDRKKRDDLKKLAEEIRENVRRTVNEALSGINESSAEKKYALSVELDAIFPTEHTVAETKNADIRGGDDFWDLGKPKERIYAPPEFSKKSLSVTDVSDERDRDGAVEFAEDGTKNERVSSEKNVQAEKILPREAYNFDSSQRKSRSGSGSSSAKVRITVDGPRAFPSDSGSRVVTSSYKRRSPVPSAPEKKAPKPSETVKTYTPAGILIREVSIRTWESDMEFYGRFAADAHQSHSAQPKTPYSAKLEITPCFSYVPQYAHMNLSQVECYRYIRENIRHGIYPDCDLAYIQLYIFEIINLPDIIPADEGAKLLAAIWLNYRSRHPRLDSFLCEWLADYCLIGGCPLPEEISPILHEIVPKAQFKEFYLNSLTASDNRDLGLTVLEVSSDYDYRSGRYYKDHAEDYNRHIPAAVGLAMNEAKNEKRGIFAMDRVYRMTRDSYSGAIAASGIKRRIDIEFLSFTRRADTRQAVTAIAKYAENRLRAVLGIKAKLGVDKISPQDTAVIDRYFAPLMPQAVKKPSEDRYMPEDYMKNYESEDSGFDFSAAKAIEVQSWMNTSRLTGDDTFSEDLPSPTSVYTEDAEGEQPAVTGAISSDSADIFTVDEPLPFDPLSDAPPPAGPEQSFEEPAASEETYAPPADSAEPDDEIREALRAALLGEFRLYCRKNNLYEGEAAERVNNIFLDEIGDVVLENTGSGFELIEDYREDVENWLQ